MGRDTVLRINQKKRRKKSIHAIQNMDALLQVFYNHLSTHCYQRYSNQGKITLISLGKESGWFHDPKSFAKL